MPAPQSTMSMPLTRCTAMMANRTKDEFKLKLFYVTVRVSRTDQELAFYADLKEAERQAREAMGPKNIYDRFLGLLVVEQRYSLTNAGCCNFATDYPRNAAGKII